MVGGVGFILIGLSHFLVDHLIVSNFRYKARWLALSVVVGGVGFILIGLPHFLTGLYEWGQSDERICRRGGKITSIWFPFNPQSAKQKLQQTTF